MLLIGDVGVALLFLFVPRRTTSKCFVDFPDSNTPPPDDGLCSGAHVRPCRYSVFPLVTELRPRGRLDVVGASGGGEEGQRRALPRLARLTEAISGVLDDYTMVRRGLVSTGF